MDTLHIAWIVVLLTLTSFIFVYRYWHHRHSASLRLLITQANRVCVDNIRIYTYKLRRRPRNTHVLVQRGVPYYELKEYRKAIENCDIAIKLNPKYVLAYLTRAQSYSALHQYQRAIQDVDEAIKLEPTNACAYHIQGCIYLDMQNIEQARISLQKSKELEPASIQYGWTNAWFQMCQSGPETTMADQLDTIAVLEPQHYFAFVCRGAALWLRNKYEEALVELEQAIMLEPHFEDAYFWKGMACISLNKDEEAKTTIAKALDEHLPSFLLTPLTLFEHTHPDLYEQYIKPLLRGLESEKQVRHGTI